MEWKNNGKKLGYNRKATKDTNKLITLPRITEETTAPLFFTTSKNSKYSKSVNRAGYKSKSFLK